MMLKRNPSLTDQAKYHIKQRILSEEFEEGRIPSEATLASELGVSRTTIRDALSRLELEGVIYRKQGAGTFVNEAGLQIKIRMEEIWGYEAMLTAHGYKPSTEIISVTEKLADAKLARELTLALDEPVLAVEKLFLADNEPVIFTMNYLPCRIFKQPYRADDFHMPIYEFLPRYCQQYLAYYLSEIVPLIAPDWLVERLHVQPPAALVSFREVGYNQDNIPILKARSYFRDEMLRLRLIRRQTVPTG